MRKASFLSVAAWTLVISWPLLVIVQMVLEMRKPEAEFLSSLGLVAVTSLVAALGLGVLLGLWHTLRKHRRQERTVTLGCDCVRAHELCLASLEVFPSKDLVREGDGFLQIRVRNNPLLRPLPDAVRRLIPGDYNWTETITIRIRPLQSLATEVCIEGELDGNSVLCALNVSGQFNVDRIVEYLSAHADLAGSVPRHETAR